MSRYLESFTLPTEREKDLIVRRMAKNGNTDPEMVWKYGYIDNEYPCGIFGPKCLSEIWFRKTTIFYGGNGSGKSTLLNLIAAKLGLERIAPFNSSELFDAYAAACEYTVGEDDEGCRIRILVAAKMVGKLIREVLTTIDEIGSGVNPSRINLLNISEIHR